MEKLAPTISVNDALILQRLSEVGEEDLNYIADELHESRGRIIRQLAALKRKGLIHITNTYGELMISLTVRGKRAIRYLWPEAQVYA